MEKIDINKRFIFAVNALISEGIVPTKGTISDVLGVKPSKFSEILNERMNVGVDMLADLCHVYNISADWLLLGEGSMLRNEATADHIPDAGKMVSTGKEAVGEPSDNGLTDYLRAQNDDLRARITQLERQNAVLEYRLEHSGEDK